MQPADLMHQPFAALRRHKLRTALTTLGVVVGAFVLAASLSAGQGVQETLARESRRLDVGRRISVYSNWQPEATDAEKRAIQVEGAMSEARRERLRRAIAEKETTRKPARRITLTRDRLHRLAAIPHVERSVPAVDLPAGIFATLDGGKPSPVFVASTAPDGPGRSWIVAGRFFESPGERGALIGELLAYRLGAVDEADVACLVGKTLHLEFQEDRVDYGLRVFLYTPDGQVGRDASSALAKVKARLPLALEHLGLEERELAALRAAMAPGATPGPEPVIRTEDFPIVGVVRRPTDAEAEASTHSTPTGADVYLPSETATDVYFKNQGQNEESGVHRAELLVDDERNVKEVLASVRALGVQASAAVDYIDEQRLLYLLIFAGMTCIAGAAMFVAAIGIANTMVMSVLERTREIGVMKAVGADDRDLLVLFLVEGALIGLVGGVVGLGLAWAASYPADEWVRDMVKRDLNIRLTGGIFVFPPWLIAIVLAMPVVVTELAAVYPARRAARIDPVAALRHE